MCPSCRLLHRHITITSRSVTIPRQQGQYTIVRENAVTLGPNRAEALGEGRNIGVLDLGW